jgi:hypothetical protein
MVIGLVIWIFSIMVTIWFVQFAYAKGSIITKILSILFMGFVGLLTISPIVFGFNSHYGVNDSYATKHDAIIDNAWGLDYDSAFYIPQGQQKAIELYKLDAWVHSMKLRYPFYYFYFGKTITDSFAILKLDNLKNTLDSAHVYTDSSYQIRDPKSHLSTPLYNKSNVEIVGIHDSLSLKVTQKNADKDSLIGTIFLKVTKRRGKSMF